MRLMFKRAKILLLAVVICMSVIPLSNATAAFTTTPMIAAGSCFTVALKSDGTVWTWGDNCYGQLGNGTKTNSSIPIQITTLANITAVSAGGDYTIALKSDGTVWGWGRNFCGQLGDGSTTERTTPVQVSGLSNVTAIATVGAVWAAHFYHTVALKSDGTVWAWGNISAQFSDSTMFNQKVPVQFSGLNNVTAISAGECITVALKSDGTVWTIGENSQGQLGDGTWNNSFTPVQVSSLTNVTAISTGYYYSIALKSNGTVWGWGSNDHGQLGDGASYRSIVPTQTLGLTGITAISAGTYHATALQSDGTVWAWGRNNYGNLGDGTTTNRTTPIKVSGLSGVSAVAAASDHTVALKSDGTVWAWGANVCGNLGDGTTTSRNTPVQVVDGKGGKFNLKGQPTPTNTQTTTPPTTPTPTITSFKTNSSTYKPGDKVTFTGAASNFNSWKIVWLKNGAEADPVTGIQNNRNISVSATVNSTDYNGAVLYIYPQANGGGTPVKKTVSFTVRMANTPSGTNAQPNTSTTPQQTQPSANQTSKSPDPSINTPSGTSAKSSITSLATPVNNGSNTTVTSGQKVYVAWKTVNNAQHYRVYYNDGTKKGPFEATGTSYSFTAPTVTKDTNMTIQVYACGSYDGKWVQSSPLSFNVLVKQASNDSITVSGLKSQKINKGEKLKLDGITVTSQKSNLSKITVNVLNWNPELPITVNAKTCSLKGKVLDTSSLPVGVYEVRIWARNATHDGIFIDSFVLTVEGTTKITPPLIGNNINSNWPKTPQTAFPGEKATKTNKEIQQKLKDLGYVGRNGKPIVTDGEIGANTIYAITQFQVLNELSQLNIVDLPTQDVLFSINAKSFSLPTNYKRPVRTYREPILGACFGAYRDANRDHAAADFAISPDTPVYAITGGYVTSYYHFWADTYALEVKNDDGTTFRYCEIETTLDDIDNKTPAKGKNITSLNIRIEQGQKIAKMIPNTDPSNGGSMLHLEYYRNAPPPGTSTLLEYGGNTSFDYVGFLSKKFQRRKDILDPTPIHNLPTW